MEENNNEMVEKTSIFGKFKNGLHKTGAWISDHRTPIAAVGGAVAAIGLGGIIKGLIGGGDSDYEYDDECEFEEIVEYDEDDEEVEDSDEDDSEE